VSPRTAVRRSAVVGLGALSALALAAPAAALSVGEAVEPVAGVVDPLTGPLQPALEPVVEAAAPVVEAAPAPVQEVAQEAAPAPAAPAPAAAEQPAAVAPPPAPSGSAPAPAPAPAPADPAVVATGVVGSGMASMPSSFSGSATNLEGFSGRGAGFGTAANPMSLFGAPQVAMAPQLSEEIPSPLAVTAAGGSLVDVLPVGAPDGVPGALVAVACTVVAGAVAAHVAALRTRRETVTA
jgi:hypothetical protein